MEGLLWALTAFYGLGAFLSLIQAIGKKETIVTPNDMIRNAMRGLVLAGFTLYAVTHWV